LTKENLAFLAGGFAFGILAGVALFNALHSGPELDAPAAGPASVPQPAGPMAPTQVGGGGMDVNAPMVAEINELKRRLQEDPSNLEAATRLAHIFHDVEIWDQGAIYYEKAVELSPDDPDLLTDLGICYRGLQRFDDALAVFARARAANPDHWQSLFNTAVVAAFDLGDYDRAMEALEPLARMDPPPPQVLDLRQAVEHAREATANQVSP
jgi:tetratricopeptide (TPR) repeat protein